LLLLFLTGGKTFNKTLHKVCQAASTCSCYRNVNWKKNFGFV